MEKERLLTAVAAQCQCYLSRCQQVVCAPQPDYLDHCLQAPLRILEAEPLLQLGYLSHVSLFAAVPGVAKLAHPDEMWTLLLTRAPHGFLNLAAIAVNAAAADGGGSNGQTLVDR